MKKITLILITLVIMVTACKKNDDPKPVVTDPTPTTPAPYKVSLFMDMDSDSVIARHKQDGTIQDSDYTDAFSYIIIEKEGTDSVIVGMIIGLAFSTGVIFEWDTLKFVGDSVVFISSLDSLYGGGAYSASVYTIHRNSTNIYKLDCREGFYGVGLSEGTIDIKKQPQVYKELKPLLTPEDLITFGKYFE